MQNYTKITLGELLSSTNDTIRRNAISIYKNLSQAIKCGCGRIYDRGEKCDECKIKVS